MTESNATAVEAFREAFSFVLCEREDVRKMAIHGIAAQSRDNADLCTYLVTKAGHASIEVLLQNLHLGASKLLGDILTVLINCSVDAQCAEVFVQKKIIRKAMRLLDSFHSAHSTLPSVSLARSLQELTLMLLSNLTSSYIIAVDEFLQKNDEEMRGFYLGKLQTLYDRCMEEVADEESSPEAEERRDLRRWMLQVVLNLTRCVDGQEQVLGDEGWQKTLLENLSAPVPAHRLIAAQTLRNCSTAPQPLYPLLLKGGSLLLAIHRLSSEAPGATEPVPEIQFCLAEFVAGMLESEDGVEQLESINAKKLLSAALRRSEEAEEKRGNPRVVEGPETTSTESEQVVVLESSVREFLDRHVLPHLDDVIDAYLAPGSDVLD